MEERIVARLQKLLALTNSPVEGEAQAAAARLQQLLLEHNLSVADLERRGAKKAPSIQEQAFDLGKAAFRWKLNLARQIAQHYFCHAIVDDTAKTVLFVGRPDNVESLQMLYGWVIDQIKRISSETRKEHHRATGEHVDPLRWQVNFGLGAVDRLTIRLEDMRTKHSQEETALVVHHASEVSDYLEQTRGFRVDGQRTKKEQERFERWQAMETKWAQEREERRQRLARLKETDIEAYYLECPHERPRTAEEIEEDRRYKEMCRIQDEKRREQERKREERNARRRKGTTRVRQYTEADRRRDQQAEVANDAGYRAADKVNLRPFLEQGTVPSGELK